MRDSEATTVSEQTLAWKGHETWYRVVGDLGGPPPLVIAHGGPGATHDYLTAIADLANAVAASAAAFEDVESSSTRGPETGPGGHPLLASEQLLDAGLGRLSGSGGARVRPSAGRRRVVLTDEISPAVVGGGGCAVRAMASERSVRGPQTTQHGRATAQTAAVAPRRPPGGWTKSGSHCAVRHVGFGPSHCPDRGPTAARAATPLRRHAARRWRGKT
jgi:hypothetical protein